MALPCDFVPMDKRLDQLESQFLRANQCTCEGLKYVGFHFPTQHQDFGRSVPCICSRDTEMTSRKEILVNVSRLKEKKTFSDFDLSLNPRCKAGYDASMDWATNKSTPMVVLYGQAGVGKTHLAVSAAWTKIGLGDPVLYYSSAELVRELQNAVNKGTLDTLIQSVKSAQNLVIDDLGREYSTNWTTSIFHEIIDYRYTNKLSLNTLITTNHSLSELKEIIGTPAVSRLTDFHASTFVVMDGQDARRKKR